MFAAPIQKANYEIYRAPGVRSGSLRSLNAKTTEAIRTKSENYLDTHPRRRRTISERPTGTKSSLLDSIVGLLRKSSTGDKSNSRHVDIDKRRLGSKRVRHETYHGFTEIENSNDSHIASIPARKNNPDTVSPLEELFEEADEVLDKQRKISPSKSKHHRFTHSSEQNAIKSGDSDKHPNLERKLDPSEFSETELQHSDCSSPIMASEVTTAEITTSAAISITTATTATTASVTTGKMTASTSLTSSTIDNEHVDPDEKVRLEALRKLEEYRAAAGLTNMDSVRQKQSIGSHHGVDLHKPIPGGLVLPPNVLLGSSLVKPPSPLCSDIGETDGQPVGGSVAGAKAQTVKATKLQRPVSATTASTANFRGRVDNRIRKQRSLSAGDVPEPRVRESATSKIRRLVSRIRNSLSSSN